MACLNVSHDVALGLFRLPPVPPLPGPVGLLGLAHYVRHKRRELIHCSCLGAVHGTTP